MLKKTFNTIFGYKVECQKGMNPLYSKTMWTNIVALVGIYLTKKYGIELGTEEVTAILAIINIFLRFISKRPVGFYEEKESIEERNKITRREGSIEIMGCKCTDYIPKEEELMEDGP